jgi:hypothetical protein
MEIMVVEEIENETLKKLGLKFGCDLNRLINDAMEKMALSGEIEYYEATSLVLTCLSAEMVAIARENDNTNLATDYVHAARRHLDETDHDDRPNF